MPKYVPPYDTKEQHLPFMNYAGPGTNVARRIRNNVEPMDRLDAACVKHDMVTEPRGPYTSGGDSSKLRAADRRLIRDAKELVKQGYQPKWVAEAIIKAMQFLLWTGARGRS
ncbi:hypothetical protein N9X31_02115 [Candidatus Poseidoniales archaeon]|nr:hypothetical protein [Candidatus Poseidoniales archaeon]